MSTIDLDKLRECVELARELERIAEKVTPMLQLIKELGNDKDVLIPPVPDRLLRRSEVAKILRINAASVAGLVKRGQLIPLYVNSHEAKFRFSEVKKIMAGRS